MDKNNKNNIGIERRIINMPVELRAGEDSRTIEGYAAKFDSLSERIWWFKEKIDRKAFDNTDMAPCVALFNHDENMIIGRVGKNLKLEVREDGLFFSCDLPKTNLANDLLENIRNGIVEKCSFAFTVRKQSWEIYNDPNDKEVEEIRTIMEIDTLYDVSPVTRPAYSETSVDARSFENLKKDYENRKKETLGLSPSELAQMEDDLQYFDLISKL